MKKYTTILFLLFMVVITSNLFAEEPGDRFTEKEIQNLITGIRADNNGLKRSSIYLAGKYKVAETTDVLLDVLDSETEPANIILIALAIYQIGDREAMMKVIDVANLSHDLKVKHMLSSIGLEFLAENGLPYVVR